MDITAAFEAMHASKQAAALPLVTGGYGQHVAIELAAVLAERGVATISGGAYATKAQPAGTARRPLPRLTLVADVRTSAHPCYTGDLSEMPTRMSSACASARSVVPLWYYGGMAMNLRLDDEDSALLRALADAEHVSLHEAALRAIRRSAREIAHTDRVRAATAEMLDRWGEVLDRLGQA